MIEKAWRGRYISKISTELQVGVGRGLRALILIEFDHS